MRRALIVLPLLTLALTLAASAKESPEEQARGTFLQAMKSEDVAVREAAVKALGRLDSVATAELLVETVLAREQSGRVLGAAVTALARLTDETAVLWLVGIAKRGKWHVRAMVLEALASRIDPSPVYEAFLKAADDRDARIRSMALFGLGRGKRAEALPALLEGLEAKEWQVRVAAIEGLRELGNESAVKPLILRLREETGRLRGDISDALEDLTGKKFGLDVDLWMRWLEAKEAGEEEPEKVAARPPGEDPGASSVAKEPTYYGIKVLSEKVIFVIDLSLSMKDPIEIDKRELMGETRARSPRDDDGKVGEKEGEKFEDTIKWWKIKCGLDLAKAQLVFAIGQLDRRQSFEIITFSEEAEAWQGRLVKATPMARAKAANFIENLDVIGRTNSYAALDLAFELAGKGRNATGSYENSADTIFFLSDGAPSVGQFVKPEDILHEIARRNRTRKIKIHVIGLNVKVPFLRMLAEQNGGTYKTF